MIFIMRMFDITFRIISYLNFNNIEIYNNCDIDNIVYKNTIIMFVGVIVRIIHFINV